MSARVEGLKDTVMQTLDAKGVLARIKAELRSSVFSVIQSDDSGASEFLKRNEKILDLMDDPVLRIAVDLIREFLDFFDLDFTHSVFASEARLRADAETDREKRSNELGIDVESPLRPLLVEIIDTLKNKKDSSKIIEDEAVEEKKENAKEIETLLTRKRLGPLPPLNSMPWTEEPLPDVERKVDDKDEKDDEEKQLEDMYEFEDISSTVRRAHRVGEEEKETPPQEKPKEVVRTKQSSLPPVIAPRRVDELQRLDEIEKVLADSGVKDEEGKGKPEEKAPLPTVDEDDYDDDFDVIPEDDMPVDDMDDTGGSGFYYEDENGDALGSFTDKTIENSKIPEADHMEEVDGDDYF